MMDGYQIRERNRYMQEQQNQGTLNTSEPDVKVLDDQAKVLDSPIKSDTLTAGKRVYVRVPGRTGKPITVRGTIDTVFENTVLVELFPEFKLPVRFMYAIPFQDVV